MAKLLATTCSYWCNVQQRGRGGGRGGIRAFRCMTFIVPTAHSITHKHNHDIVCTHCLLQSGPQPRWMAATTPPACARRARTARQRSSRKRESQLTRYTQSWVGEIIEHRRLASGQRSAACMSARTTRHQTVCSMVVSAALVDANTSIAAATSCTATDNTTIPPAQLVHCPTVLFPMPSPSLSCDSAWQGCYQQHRRQGRRKEEERTERGRTCCQPTCVET